MKMMKAILGIMMITVEIKGQSISCTPKANAIDLITVAYKTRTSKTSTGNIYVDAISIKMENKKNFEYLLECNRNLPSTTKRKSILKIFLRESGATEDDWELKVSVVI